MPLKSSLSKEVVSCQRYNWLNQVQQLPWEGGLSSQAVSRHKFHWISLCASGGVREQRCAIRMSSWNHCRIMLHYGQQYDTSKCKFMMDGCAFVHVIDSLHDTFKCRFIIMVIGGWPVAFWVRCLLCARLLERIGPPTQDPCSPVSAQ